MLSQYTLQQNYYERQCVCLDVCVLRRVCAGTYPSAEKDDSESSRYLLKLDVSFLRRHHTSDDNFSEHLFLFKLKSAPAMVRFECDLMRITLLWISVIFPFGTLIGMKRRVKGLKGSTQRTFKPQK